MQLIRKFASWRRSVTWPFKVVWALTIGEFWRRRLSFHNSKHSLKEPGNEPCSRKAD